MKKIANFMFPVILLVLITLVFNACNKDIKEKDKFVSVDVKSTQQQDEDTMIVVGSFSSGEPAITLPYEALDSFYRWFFGVEGQNVILSSVIIDDDLSINDAVIYLIFTGSNQEGESAILGLRLFRDYDDDIYYIPTEMFGGKWTCKGKNCSGCSPKRKGGRRSKVIGCDCTGGAIDGDKPSGCEHSVSGGGGASTWIGVLVSIIGLFT